MDNPTSTAAIEPADDLAEFAGGSRRHIHPQAHGCADIARPEMIPGALKTVGLGQRTASLPGPYSQEIPPVRAFHHTNDARPGGRCHTHWSRRSTTSTAVRSSHYRPTQQHASYEQAAALADPVLEPTDGLLARLAEFFEAPAEKAKESGHDDGFDLHYGLKDAAATVRGLGEDLHVAVDRTRALAPSFSTRRTTKVTVPGTSIGPPTAAPPAPSRAL